MVIKIQHIKVCWYSKTEFTGKFTTLNAFIGKEERYENNDPRFHLGNLEEKECNTPEQVENKKREKHKLYELGNEQQRKEKNPKLIYLKQKQIDWSLGRQIMKNRNTNHQYQK